MQTLLGVPLLPSHFQVSERSASQAPDTGTGDR